MVVPVPVPVPSASQPAPSTSEPAVSDTSIEVDINSKLIDDGDLRSHPLSVKFSGGTVTLSGSLPSEELKTRAEQVAKTVKGVSDGCIEADVALLGGETAIMPDIYARGDYDLAGFCVGVVEKAQVIDG